MPKGRIRPSIETTSTVPADGIPQQYIERGRNAGALSEETVTFDFR